MARLRSIVRSSWQCRFALVLAVALLVGLLADPVAAAVDIVSPTPGWTVTGEAPWTYFGQALAIAGDVNGDGFADVVVGAYAAGNGAGKAYLYLGSAGGPAGSPAWTASGEATNSFYGFTVAGAGDVNGDGYDDVLVGAYGLNAGFGKAYLYLGSATGLSATPAWTGAGLAQFSSYGVAVAGAGDVNNDGYADVLIGSSGYSTSTGRAYLYLGGAGGLSITPAWTGTGEGTSNFFGLSLAGVGDVNGDGYDDAIVGAYAFSNASGKAYFYLGNATGLDTTPAWIKTGAANSYLGIALSAAGDINADGYADVAVGSPGGAGALGKAFVFFGSAAGLNTTPAWTGTGTAAGGQFGYPVVGIGDVNKDGYGDVAVAEWGANTYAGKTYVFLGTSTGLGATPAWSAAGEAAIDHFGFPVVAGGDLNGDTYPDILVGAGYNNDRVGKVYAYYAVPPGQPVISGPGKFSNNPTPSLSFDANPNANGIAGYACSLDGAVPAPCTSPVTVGPLVDGTHLFTATSTDGLGSVSWPGSYAWTVDTGAPAAPSISGPPDPLVIPHATFYFTSTDTGSGVASYTCALDNLIAPTPCTSPASYNGMVNGSHAYTVTATDKAGNTSSASYVWTVALDTTPPTTPTIDAANPYTTSTTRSFTFGATDAGSGISYYLCTIDLAGPVFCTSPFTVGPLANGGHSIVVRAFDNNNNVSPPAATNWWIDTVAPAAPTGSGPAGLSNSISPTFTFTATDTGTGIASFMCSLDGGTAAPCTSPATLGPLADGAHSLIVRAVDKAGNQSPPKTWSWSLDATAPGVSVNQAPGQADPATSLPILFTAIFGEPVTDLTAADVTLGGTANLGAAGATVTGSGSVYTISVSGVAGNGTVVVSLAGGVAVDTAGNGNPASISTDNSVTYQSDVTGPTAPTVGGPGPFSNSASPTFTFTSTDTGGGGTTFLCSLDGAAPAPCTSPMTPGSLVEGSHTFTVTAQDGAGNASTPTGYAWVVDMTPPTAGAAALPAPNAAGWNNTDVMVTFSATDGGAGVSTCTPPVGLTQEGTFTNLAGVCTDKAGNTSTPATVAAVRIDKTPPVNVSGAPVGSPSGAGGWYATPLTVQFSGSDPLSGIASCTSVVYSGPSSGAASVNGTCTDKAGNVSEPAASQSFQFSSTASQLFLPELSSLTRE